MIIDTNNNANTVESRQPFQTEADARDISGVLPRRWGAVRLLMCKYSMASLGSCSCRPSSARQRGQDVEAEV